MKEFWNNRYKESKYAYGKEPNLFFKYQLSKLNPGKIVLPAAGEGRNAVFAAQKGWDVTAVDYSPEAAKKALLLAEHQNVKIQYHISDLDSVHLPDSEYDAAAFIFVHLPRSIIENVYSKIIQSLKPGASIIIEVYSVNQLGRDSGGPKDQRVLYTKDKLRSLLTGTEIQFLEETETDLNEGRFHVGKAMVLRALAVKT